MAEKMSFILAQQYAHAKFVAEVTLQPHNNPNVATHLQPLQLFAATAPHYYPPHRAALLPTATAPHLPLHCAAPATAPSRTCHCIAPHLPLHCAAPATHNAIVTRCAAAAAAMPRAWRGAQMLFVFSCSCVSWRTSKQAMSQRNR